ncbi:MAG TPA: hypothetical protein VHL79_14995 [Ramlibacter sp.]|jgi:hypothetical protein|nr:hypothetical protein [Ramlibacter sp.]
MLAQVLETAGNAFDPFDTSSLEDDAAAHPLPESAGMLLPRLADMTTALSAKCAGTVQSLATRLHERPTEGVQELEFAVHALQAGVSRLMWFIDRSAASPECQQSFEDLAALTSDAWTSGSTLLAAEAEVGARTRQVAVEVTLEMTVMQRRFERADELAATIRQDLHKRGVNASVVRRKLLQRLAEREAAESEQLRGARGLYRQADQVAQAFVQLTGARTRVCTLVQHIRFAAIALQDGLHPLVRGPEPRDPAALPPLQQLADHLRFTLIQAGAELVRMQMHETTVRTGLAALRQQRSG